MILEVMGTFMIGHSWYDGHCRDVTLVVGRSLSRCDTCSVTVTVEM